MDASELTRRLLKRRRYLAVKELLHSYRVEYAQALEELGKKGYDWVKTPAELTEFQKGVVTANFEDYVKKSCDVQPIDVAEREEMEGKDHRETETSTDSIEIK